MSTRNMTMVIDRDYASNHELGFAQNPELLEEHRDKWGVYHGYVTEIVNMMNKTDLK